MATERSQNTVSDERPGNFFIIENAVVDTYLPVIGTTAFAVYAYLARRAGNKEDAFPSIARAARDIGMSPATVSRAFGVLAGHVIKTDNKRGPFSLLGEAGLPPLISIEPRYNEAGDQTSSNYILHRTHSPVRGGSLTSEGGVTSPVREGHLTSEVQKNTQGRRLTEEDPSGKPQDMPDGPSPRDIIEAFCAHTGVPDSAMSRAEYGIAKSLVGKGMTPDRLPALHDFASKDYLGRHGVDLKVMLAVCTKFLVWEAAEAKRPQSVFGDAFVNNR